MRLAIVFFALLQVTTWGCTTRNPAFDPELLDDKGVVPSDLGVSEQTVLPDLSTPDVTEPPLRPTAVDLLLVVDNSGGTATLQLRLARDIDALVAALDRLPGGPNYRIGIVTTDMGVGPFASKSCSAEGDSGLLQIRRGCPDRPPTGQRYLERIGDKANVDGDLAEALACQLRLGEDGCGFEQPLKSMHAALTEVNDGFLRQEAALAVVVVTDEDDCSAAEGQELFDPTNEALGPYASFRCFQYGILCDGDRPPSQTGELSGCAPGQRYLHDVKTRYVDALLALKPPGWVSVLVLAGPADEPVQVVEADTTQGTYWRLSPSCSSGALGADPAFRLRSFAAAFGGAATFESICQGSYGDAFGRLADRIGN